MVSFDTPGGECKSNASLTGFPFSPALWLWAAWSGHLALRVPRQLCHLLPQLPFAVCSQPSHRHRHHCHGDGLPGLPGGHQGKQVPPPQCKLDPHPQPSELWITLHLGHSDRQGLGTSANIPGDCFQDVLGPIIPLFPAIPALVVLLTP